MQITFTTPSHLDLRSLQIMGLSAKETDNPIGRFGTGLKYAISVILRHQGKIDLYIGPDHYTFSTQKSTFRNKDFDQIILHHPDGTSTVLPFTLDYGRDWKPWQAFRELYSNTLDEGGTVHDHPPAPLNPRNTTIYVTCHEFAEVYKNLHLYVIDPERESIFTDFLFSIYPAPDNAWSSTIYYQNIRVLQTEKPSLYTWNFYGGIDLSENREADASTVQRLPMLLAQALRTLATENKQVAKNILTAHKDTLEGSICYPYSLRHGNPIYNLVEEMIAEGSIALINPAAISSYRKEAPPSTTTYPPATLSSRQQDMWEEAKTIISLISHYEFENITISDQLPNNILGLCSRDGHIFISTAAFRKGLATVIGTLFEELSHRHGGYTDESRAFQDYLIDTVANLLIDKHDNYKDQCKG